MDFTQNIETQIKEFMDKLNSNVTTTIKFITNDTDLSFNTALKNILTPKDIFNPNVGDIDEDLCNLLINFNKIHSFVEPILTGDSIDISEDNEKIIYANYIKQENKYVICLLIFEGLDEDTIFMHANNSFNQLSFLNYFFNKFFETIRKNSSIIDTQDFLILTSKDFLNQTLINNNTDLFTLFKDISTLQYEGVNIKAKLLITNDPLKSSYIDFYIKLQEKIDLVKDYRKIRKLLEMSDDTIYLISDANYIYGLGKPTGFEHISPTDFFIIDFVGRFEYKVKTLYPKKKIEKSSNSLKEIIEFSLTEKTILSIQYGNPSLKENRFSIKKFKYELSTAFKNITKEAIDNISNIVKLAKNQTHGTMVVITTPDLAKSEVEILNSECLKIEKVNLNLLPNRQLIINKLTSIDGALYLDTEGICHAIGVILDGLANGNGNSARGARYNSAKRYVNKLLNTDVSYNVVIVVISEDGMVDVLSSSNDNTKIISLLKTAKSLFNEHQYDDSLKLIDEILALNSTHFDSIKLKASILAKQNKLTDCIDFFTEVISLNPITKEYYALRGYVYSLNKDFNKAISDYSEAISQDPNYTHAIHNRGIAYKRLNKFDEALNDLNTAISLDKNYALAYMNRGSVYRSLEYYDKAINDLNKAIQLDPTIKLSYTELNLVYENLTKINPDKATDYNKLIEANNVAIKSLCKK